MADGMQQAQGQGGDPSTLPTDVLTGMRAVGQALQQAGAPEPLMAKLAQSVQLYEEVLQEVSGGAPQGNRPEPRQVETMGSVAGPQG